MHVIDSIKYKLVELLDCSLFCSFTSRYITNQKGNLFLALMDVWQNDEDNVTL